MIVMSTSIDGLISAPIYLVQVYIIYNVLLSRTTLLSYLPRVYASKITLMLSASASKKHKTLLQAVHISVNHKATHYSLSEYHKFSIEVLVRNVYVLLL